MLRRGGECAHVQGSADAQGIHWTRKAALVWHERLFLTFWEHAHVSRATHLAADLVQLVFK